MQAVVSQQGSLRGPNLTLQDFSLEMQRSLNGASHDRSATDWSLASQTTRYELMLLYEEATFYALRCSSREGATWMQYEVGKLLFSPLT